MTGEERFLILAITIGDWATIRRINNERVRVR